MENIRKKLLLTKLSLETTLAFKLATFRLRFRKNVSTDDVLERVEFIEVIESDNADSEYNIVEPKESIEDILEREMVERVKEGRKGINLLFTNIRFLMALVAKRSDVITLILEQYFIENKINEVTIEAFLDSPHVCFTEDEKALLRGLVDSGSKKVVLT